MSRDLRREERSRAFDQAVWAIRDHGDNAEAAIRAKLDRPQASASDIRRYQHCLRCLKDLRRREARDGGRTPPRRPSSRSPIRRLLRALFGG